MRLLHINSYFSTSPLFNELYRRQQENGLDIEVYVPIPFSYPENKLSIKGSYANVRRNHHQISRWIFPWKHQVILKDLLQQYDFTNFDLIHAHSLFSNGWLAYQLYCQFNIPYIVAVRNADLRTFFQRMPWMRRTGIKILENAAQIIYISKNTYNEVMEKYIPRQDQKNFRHKSQVIPNGIDDFWHTYQSKKQDYQVHNPIRIVTTAKIMRTKRLVNLANRVKKYAAKYRPAELHIIGPKWEQATYNKLAQFPHVILHGPKDKPEMVELYRKMDLFALLSYPETFGLVYVEAMSQGLPIIYTRGEGFDNYFDNYQIGVSVDPHNQNEFDQAVNFIIQESHFARLSDTATNSIQSFNWQDISQIYANLYTNLREAK